MSVRAKPRKRVGIDIGGTFTDLVAYDEITHELTRAKVPTTPQRPEAGLLNALSAAGLVEKDLVYLVHGTTLVTNLVLERDGAKTGLITTAGFRDVLEIMRASRPRPYDLDWVKPEPIVPRDLRFEVAERVGPDGQVLEPLDESDARSVVQQLVENGVQAVAICFLHSYANPAHEDRMAEIVRSCAPELHVTTSAKVCREIREFERTSTVVVNAYAIPRVVDYIGALEASVAPPGGIRYITSEGGVVPARDAAEKPVALALSGPAAGVLAGQFLGAQIGAPDLITMDMGGTSLDVCVVHQGEPQLDSNLNVEWGIPIRIPSMPIHTIGAGGGSIVWVDGGGVLQIGPASAGAAPGPACYGLGGDKPTVTDANVVLGLVDPDAFLGGAFAIDPALAFRALEPIAAEFGTTVPEAAHGIYRLANARMAQAVRAITVERGLDPRTFTLVSFGGAGGQHSIAVAREAMIPRVILPVAPSVFSALGMVTADARASASLTLMKPVADIAVAAIHQTFLQLEDSVRPTVSFVDESAESIVRTLDMRYESQSHELSIPWVEGDSVESLVARFEEHHHRQYGTRLGDPVDVVTIRSTVIRKIAPIELHTSLGTGDAEPYAYRSVYPFEEPLPVYKREHLGLAAIPKTPCLIEEVDTTHFLPTGCQAVLDAFGNIIVNLEAES